MNPKDIARMITEDPDVLNEDWEELGIEDPGLGKQPDARIYHKAFLWAGSFIESGAMDRDEFEGIAHGRPDTSPNSGSEVAQAFGQMGRSLFMPHPLYVDAIMKEPDETWIKTLEFQSRAFVRDFKMHNIKMLDREWISYPTNPDAGELWITYEANANLDEFCTAMDWDSGDIKEMEDSGKFKILRKIP